MALRYAFDIGTNSISAGPCTGSKTESLRELLDCGVRLFSDGRNPKDSQSLAVSAVCPARPANGATGSCNAEPG